MSALVSPADANYRDLLAAALPKVIRSEEENDHYLSVLEKLHDRDHLTPDEEQLSDLLTLLIEDYESQHYQLRPASPGEVLRELMDMNSLKPSDLLDVFGTKNVLSEVLSGKRDLSKSHIQKLSHRFHISPELFFPPLTLV